MNNPLTNFPIPDENLLETPEVLKPLVQSHRFLAELKGVAKTMPNEGLLVSIIAMQEAKDSSAIENIITTHDELFLSEVLKRTKTKSSARKVRNYRAALRESYPNIRQSGLIRFNDILSIQSAIEPNKPGIRKLPGTVIGNASTGEVIYTPPQHPDEIEQRLDNLIEYMNDDQVSELDPLVKMALIHHQFESIHPFYDGNGRAGRILNIMYLIQKGLLDLPILDLSRYILRTKAEYYRLLQAVHDENDWVAWVLYMIKGVETTARETVEFIQQVDFLVLQTKQRMRTELPRIYSQELLKNLFYHPYTSIEFVVKSLRVTRITATRYLDLLVAHGFVTKHHAGRTYYFINEPLVRLIAQHRE